jgi:lipopolysaccharide biosynthesis regulator YciM
MQVAGDLYGDALRDQPADLRARMGLARLSLSKGDSAAALEHFHIIMGSDRTCTPEFLTLLSDICSAHEDEALYLLSLQRYYEAQTSPLLALSLAGELEVQQGKEAAEAFLRKTLVDQPSVSVAASLVLKGLQSEASLPERQVFDRLTNAEQDYRCDHCGFTGKARHWRCPGCRHWDSIHYRGDALEQSHG